MAEKKEVIRYELKEVPTQFGSGIFDNKTEEIVPIEVALARILNDLEIIKEKIA